MRVNDLSAEKGQAIRQHSGESKANTTTLQGFCFPEDGISQGSTPYFHLSGQAVFLQENKSIALGDVGAVSFDSYFNLFNLRKWVEHCNLKHLQLGLWGTGCVTVEISTVLEDRAPVVILKKTVTLSSENRVELDLCDSDIWQHPGLIYLKLIANGAAVVTNLEWQTCQVALRRPKLSLVVTTFKREQAVRKTADRFQAFIGSSSLRDCVNLLVVDNGNSAEIRESPNIKMVQNPNFGGAGGFARGLIEARRSGASHCLFMDDDASIHFESLERTWQFLAYATRTDIAVAGALSYGRQHWRLWENGAVFEGVCIGHFRGCDLRKSDEVFEMELASTEPQPKTFYGGWWFFAFAIAHVSHRPFPFFVRGDDISFSIANKFTIATLPGVLTFQDENFEEKESPLSLYLDLRNHLIHHLSLPQLDYGPLHLAWVALRFGVRALNRCHYETIMALCLALEDVQKGPVFFAENADVAQRRRDILQLINVERWRDLDVKPAAEKIRFDASAFPLKQILRLTLNGLLIPFFSRFGNALVINADDRGDQHKVMGAAKLTFLDVEQQQFYSVAHSKSQAIFVGFAFLKRLTALLLKRRRLMTVWRKGYGDITGNDDYWVKTLNIEPASAPSSPAGEKP